jgi:hypothetical protein
MNWRAGTNRNRRPVPGYLAFNRENPWIFLGTRFGVKAAKSKPGCLVAPLDLDPGSVEWPVRDLDVVLVISQDDKVQESALLARALINDGAKVVVCVGERGILSRHQKEVA